MVLKFTEYFLMGFTSHKVKQPLAGMELESEKKKM